MENRSFDPQAFKAQQRQDWDAVADGWKRWWAILEEGTQSVSQRLMELAGLEPGHRVLDVATGIGEPAVTAAQVVGPQGRVVAIDQAPRMLALARERARELGLSNIEFHEMDGEGLDFPEQSFQAVLCRWGLMFFPNCTQALVRLARVLVPGGRLAAAVWADPQKVPGISLPMKVAREVLELPPPPPDVPGPFRLADETALGQMLRKAGFDGVYTERMTVRYTFPSLDVFLQFQREIAAPLIALLREHPPERQEAVWQAIARAVAPFTDPQGRITFPNEAILVTGRRPQGG